MSGKGDRYRPVDREKYAKNYPFPDRKVKTWPRDKNGKLIGEK